MRSSLSKFVASGPDPDIEQFKRMQRHWFEHGDEIVAFRRKDVMNDYKWLEYLADATEIYGKRGK